MPDRLHPSEPGGTILDAILAHKRDELAARQERLPLAEVRARARDMAPPRDFAGALRRPRIGPVGLIAEVKKASPSAGLIREDFDPVQIARVYDKSGASCLSVLTDERFFQGSDAFLSAVRSAVAIPLLRKDFTVDAYQVYEARTLGADAILLIVAALSPEQIAELQALAQSLGMAALAEVHTEDEMAVALGAGATLIGINSRDLKTFVTDLAVVERLAAIVPRDITLVAESGIRTLADVRRVADAGAHAILVGETLMRSPDIGAAVRALMVRT